MEQHNLVLKRTGKKMIKKPYTIIILIFLFANSLATVHADEIKLTASVDKTLVEVGGDIHAPVISIEPGGIFNGNCEMKSQPNKAVKPAFFVKNQPLI